MQVPNDAHFLLLVNLPILRFYKFKISSLSVPRIKIFISITIVLKSEYYMGSVQRNFDN